jgi:hypothetical protein
MQALVVGESSGTTGKDSQSAIEYYRGNFLPTRKLAEDISQYAETDTYIMSEEFGLLNGEETIQDAEEDPEGAVKQVVEILSTHAPNTDIVVILLTTDTFRDIVVDHWEEVVESANENSIWCLGTGRGALGDVELETLRERVGDLFVYQRVGVAPIDNETREELITEVSRRAQEV